MEKHYTEADFKKLSWDEYQVAVSTIYEAVCDFCERQKLSVDMIIPIIRGGGVLGISLSHFLNVTSIYPCQYKYFREIVNGEVKYIPRLLLSTLNDIANKEDQHVVLITEGNHARGGTAQRCIDLVKDTLPRSTIIYSSVGRDYAHRDSLNKTDFECYGFLTNETESLTQEECNKLKVKDKFVVYPWENVIEELNEVNESLNSEEIKND